MHDIFGAEVVNLFDMKYNPEQNSMKYLVTAQEMKQYDKNTIEYLGIPGPVLMERAALVAEDFIKERFDAVKERTKVLILLVWGTMAAMAWR